MRPIKFRGKRIDNDEWVYGSLVIDTTDEQVTHIIDYAISDDNVYIWNPVKPETVGQYIGIEDKHGKEIYEGGRFKHPDGIIYDVVWWYDGFGLRNKADKFTFVVGAEVWNQGEIIDTDSQEVKGE